MKARYSTHKSLSCFAAKQCLAHRSSGFTLLEVMVALAIFATAAIAFTKVAMQYTQATSNAILRTKAQFVALNEVAMMEINQEWLQEPNPNRSPSKVKPGKLANLHNRPLVQMCNA